MTPLAAGEGDQALPVSLPAQDGLAAATGAEEVAERLRAMLAPLRVGLVHGRLRADDRDAEMTRFRDGELDVLVGTTVVEVGVDVPEATMMVVLNADHFGLSQLHQLRGRVGRGSGGVVLRARGGRAGRQRGRGRAWRPCVRTNDGFELAEQDWQLRREGDVLGLAQSGLPRLRLASLARREDQALAVRCRGRGRVDARRGRPTAARLRGLRRRAAERAGWRPSPPARAPPRRRVGA